MIAGNIWCGNMAHFIVSTLLFFICSFNQAASDHEEYRITPEVTDHCTTCFTLSQFAANSSHLKSNAQLMFLPGFHNLTTNLHFLSLDSVSMTVHNSTAQITCETSSHFLFEQVQYVNISNLEFTGCGRNQVQNVEHFVLQDAIFDGQEDSGTALELIETSALILNSTFKHNENGSLRNSDFLHSNNSWVGGAIIATNSNINISHSSFKCNRAEVGGAIYAEQQSIITINNTTFIGNQAAGQKQASRSSDNGSSQSIGGVLYQEKSSVIITNCQFTNNTASLGDGGALYSYRSSVVIDVSQFASNTAAHGGVLYTYGGTVTIDRSQFDDNTATCGGVIHSSNSDVTTDRSQFHDNRATYGGVLGSSNSSVTLNDSHLDLSRATWGGALHLIDSSSATITGSQFGGSTATCGAVLYSNASDVTIDKSQFHDNSAMEAGGVLDCYGTAQGEAIQRGGVLFSLSGSVTVGSSQFQDNSAEEGGVLECVISNVIMSNNQFSFNKANFGGVLNSIGSDVTEYGSHFDGNTAVTSGGALYTFYGTIKVAGSSQFDNNTAGDEGGALFSFGSEVSINESTFRGNSATFGGVLDSFESIIVIDQSKIECNRALDGGFVDSMGSRITVVRSVVDSNVATRNGVLFCSGSNIVIEGSVLNSNVAIRRGVLDCSNSNVTIEESQMNGNNGTMGGLLYSFNSNVVISDSQVNSSRANDKNPGGVLYSSRSRVSIRGSLFHNNTATDEGGVVYSTNSNIAINGSHFTGNIAIFNGGVLYSNNGNVTIDESFFIDNHALVAGVLYSNNSNITIDGSQLDANGAMWGGVLDSFGSNVTIIGSQFDDNAVVFGGGGVLRSSTSNISVNENHFTNNTSNRGGGVLHFIFSDVRVEGNQFHSNRAREGSVMYSLLSSIKTHNLLITNNSADNYGTFYLSQSTISLSGTTFSSNFGSLVAADTGVNFTGFNTFNNCSPSQISASNLGEGGALTAFQSNIYFDGTCSFENNQAKNGGALHSIESKMYMIGNTVIADNSATRNGGGIYLSQSELFCEPNSSLKLVNNTATQKGGGIHTVSSSIKCTSMVNETLLEVTDNVAEKGGGLSFESNAKLYVLKSTDFNYQISAVQLNGNSADYGGAVYVNDDTNAATCEQPSAECFFQVLALHGLLMPEVNTVSISFSQNHARRSGPTLFGGLLDRCTVSPFAEVHNSILDINSETEFVYNESGIDYFNASAVYIPNTISSNPVQVCLCFDNYPNCSYREQELIEIKKGQPFVVSLIAVDHVGQAVKASIRSSLRFSQSGLAEGQLFQKVTEKCTDLTFNVFSSEPYERLVLYADGPCGDAELSRRGINIQFLPCTCPIGFQPSGVNETNCTCQCHRNISDYAAKCDSQTESFVKSESQFNVWISHSDTTGYLVYPNCPYDYCKALDLETPINLGQSNGADAQCAFNRSSLLCGSCEPGLSLSIGTSRCLSCPGYWPALFVIIIIAAMVAGVALVALLLFLNLTVAVGSLNGLIFYANIVGTNRSIFFPYQTEPNFVTVFISFLNLDLGIDTCFFEGMNTYAKVWLKLVYPIYVMFLVVLVIVISSYSSRFSNLIGRRDPVATLATLILLSYAKLLGISFAVLSSGRLDYPDGTHELIWLPDATIGYLANKHIPLFMAAILIIIVGLIYTVVVFFWQWLLRLSKWRLFAWTRNQKLKTFIETYNAPYTPHHRYWTGLLLFVRVVLYLVAAVNVSNDPNIALTSISFTVVCVLCLKGVTNSRVYKKWPIDLLETFFYFNILFLAIFIWTSLSNYNTGFNQEPVTYISVITTFIVLLLIILYHIYAYTALFSKLHKTKFGKRLDKSFTSHSKPKSKAHALQSSDDNELLEMVYRPINTDGYSSQLHASQKPTQSVVEITMLSHQHSALPEGALNQENNIPLHKDTVDNTSSDMPTETQV